MIDLQVPQRQSPLAIVFLAIRIVRSLGIAQLIVGALFLLRAPLSGWMLVIPFVVILAFGAVSALSWWRYTFQLVDGELIVVKGVLSVDRLTVPVDRIQSLGIDQELLHRITGLVKVSVDTAGSAEAEFTIDAVSREVAEELQKQAVIAEPAPLSTPDGQPPAPAVVEDRIVFTHDGGRLVRAALTMWPLTGLLILGPLFAFGDQFIQQVEDRVGELDVDTSQFAWWWIPVGATAFLAFSVILNIGRVILADWQLTLRANATSLRRTSGLLSRTSKASSVSRIQVVSSEQNPLQQRANLRTVGLSTIGEGDLALIGCDDDQFDTIRGLAGSSSGIALDRRIDPAEVFLAVRNITVVMAIVALVAWFSVGWWALLAFAAVPLVWFTQQRHVRNFRWGLDSELATFTHVFDSSTRQALLRKTNSVRVTQSIFQRRRSLGHVHLVTGAGTISIGMIPIAEAHAVRDHILATAETDPRPWM